MNTNLMLTSAAIGPTSSPAPISNSKAEKPKHILVNALLLQSHLGGIGNYCYQILVELLKQNPECQITLLIPNKTISNFQNLQPQLTIWNIGIRSSTLRQLYLQLILPMQMAKYDLLHSIGNIGMVLCPITQIITIHDTYEKVSPERFTPWKRFFMGLLITLSGRRAAKIITDSMNTAKDIARFYPHLKNKTKVVYLGNKFPVQEATQSEPLEQNLNLGKPQNVVRNNFLFVGTLEPGKNLVTVLRAFAEYRRYHAEKLLIVGAMGWKQDELPILVKSLGIHEDVEFLGFISDSHLIQIYTQSRALILASSYEGFGLPAIEAMACGCPTILARNSSLLEAGGDSSLFFNTFDHKELALKMEKVFSEPETVHKIVHRGLEHARKFSWAKTAKESFEVYLEAGLKP